MRIVVTGRSGQLATSLLEKAAGRPGVEVVALGRPRLDLENGASVRASIMASRADLVISAAAYTAVDQAEDDPATAYAVNVSGARGIAEATARLGVPLIHVSTDYVFSGSEHRAYDETAGPNPKSIYGLTKLAGEHAVAEANARHVIIRTSWVYSPFGTNFVKTMLRLAKQQDSIRVVCDQWGTPTSALDLASALLDIAPMLREDTFGLYHLAGSGRTNWAAFARHVMEVSRRAGGPWAEIIEIPSEAYPTRASRPANSTLNSGRFGATFGFTLPFWKRSVETTVMRLMKDCVTA